MLCLRSFPQAKMFMEKTEGGNKVYRRKSFCQRAKTFVGEPFCAVLHNFLIAKKFMDKGGGGRKSIFSSENFLSHNAEKIRRGIPLVFHSFRVSKKFG